MALSLSSCRPGLFYGFNYNTEGKGKEWELDTKTESELIKLKDDYISTDEEAGIEADDEEKELFEGDLAISKDIINAFYGKDAVSCKFMRNGYRW